MYTITIHELATYVISKAGKPLYLLIDYVHVLQLIISESVKVQFMFRAVPNVPE